MLDRGLAEVLSKVLRHRDLADQLLKPKNPTPNDLHERLSRVGLCRISGGRVYIGAI